VCWSWLGPIAGRAWAVMADESKQGRRFVHRELASIEALRRGGLAVDPGARPSRAARRATAAGIEPSRPRRALQTLLQVLAGLGIVGGITIALFETWPAFDQASRWDAYRRAELVVTQLDAGSQRAQWLGTGRIDGAEVIFTRGELDVLLGAPPSSRNDPRLLEARKRRLLPADARREVLDERARFAAGFAAALFLPGALCAWLAHRLAKPRAGAVPGRRPR
jgi:hypothetical protein